MMASRATPQDGVDDQHAEVAQQDERGQRDDGAGGDDPADGGEAEEGRGGGGVGATSDGQRGLAADRGGGDVHRAHPDHGHECGQGEAQREGEDLGDDQSPLLITHEKLGSPHGRTIFSQSFHCLYFIKIERYKYDGLGVCFFNLEPWISDGGGEELP